MDIKGTIKFIGETEQITDTFKKRILVINTGGEYPSDVAFEFGQKNTDKLDNLGTGETVTVYFDPQSREHKGRWFTSLRGWKIEPEF